MKIFITPECECDVCNNTETYIDTDKDCWIEHKKINSPL